MQVQALRTPQPGDETTRHVMVTMLNAYSVRSTMTFVSTSVFPPPTSSASVSDMRTNENLWGMVTV